MDYNWRKLWWVSIMIKILGCTIESMGHWVPRKLSTAFALLLYALSSRKYQSRQEYFQRHRPSLGLYVLSNLFLGCSKIPRVTIKVLDISSILLRYRYQALVWIPFEYRLLLFLRRDSGFPQILPRSCLILIVRSVTKALPIYSIEGYKVIAHLP